MIRAFLPDGKYTHEKSMDVYIDVIESVEYEDHYTLTIIWKRRTNDEIIVPRAQKVCVLKYSMREWNIWPR